LNPFLPPRKSVGLGVGFEPSARLRQSSPAAACGSKPESERAPPSRSIYPARRKIDVTEVSEDLTGATQHPRKGAIILLVDDDSAVREVTASILRDLGYVILELGSGGAALDLLDGEANIDLVLLDFAMPA